jgi:Pol polyprotein/gag-pre-integrase-like protein
MDSGDKAAAALTKEKEPDIEAWAAIEDIESNDAALYVPTAAVEYSAKAECKIYDLGALRHMSPHCKHFVTYEMIPAHLITAANNKVFHAIGMEDLEVQLSNGKKWSKVLLKDVLHTPDMTLTVVSIGRIMKAGYNIKFDKDEQVCWICKKKNGPVIGRIPVSANNLFKVEHALSASTQLSAQPVDILMLHRRLGHISVDAIRALIRAGSITGLQLIDDFSPFICDSCEYAKTTRKPIQKE